MQNNMLNEGRGMAVDQCIVAFIKKHHVLTLATLKVSGEQPYVANCFYAYDTERNIFIFTSDSSTRHGAEMEQNPRVALSIVRETRIVGAIEGLQITGVAERGDDEAKRRYIRRFPYAAVAPLTLWMVRPEFMKLTDNKLGFGKKLIWQSEE